ncbi:hypothetical protein ABIF29_002668 [Bradyrhizobium elkanii]|uniref:Uncharacterized protein n=1 Tax=Bradyrhizobium elkanii TaxID=29448 RepID=A0ABV4EXI1_BRAEL
MSSSSNARVGQLHDIARRVASARKAAPSWCWRWFRRRRRDAQDQDRFALRTTPHAQHLYRRSVARRRALSFFKCDLSALKKRQSDAMPADIPRRFNSSCNSASVISGFAVTASKINCEWASIRCDLRSPPWRLGTMSPTSLRRLRQRIALAALTPKRSAARRQDKPPSIAATTEDQPKAPWSYMLTSFAST